MLAAAAMPDRLLTYRVGNRAVSRTWVSWHYRVGNVCLPTVDLQAGHLHQQACLHVAEHDRADTGNSGEGSLRLRHLAAIKDNSSGGQARQPAACLPQQ